MNPSPSNNPKVVRVLVIDDNRAIHDDFRKILSGDRPQVAAIGAAAAELFGPAVAGQGKPVYQFIVDVAEQGQQGLALVRRALVEGRPYAMAFVDGRMPPGWDGVETIGHLWRECPELQIVFCSAYSDYTWDQMVQRLGFAERLVILKKPFENVEALRIATVLAEKWHLRGGSRATGPGPRTFWPDHRTGGSGAEGKSE